MFWTCELRGTTRVFDSGARCRDYALEQLTVDGALPCHLVAAGGDIHFFYNDDHVARCQPLHLQFAGNPGGQVIVIAGGQP